MLAHFATVLVLPWQSTEVISLPAASVSWLRPSVTTQGNSRIFLETKFVETYFPHRSILNKSMLKTFVKQKHLWTQMKIQLVTAARWCRLTYMYHHFHNNQYSGHPLATNSRAHIFLVLQGKKSRLFLENIFFWKNTLLTVRFLKNRFLRRVFAENLFVNNLFWKIPCLENPICYRRPLAPFSIYLL